MPPALHPLTPCDKRADIMQNPSMAVPHISEGGIERSKSQIAICNCTHTGRAVTGQNYLQETSACTQSPWRSSMPFSARLELCWDRLREQLQTNAEAFRELEMATNLASLGSFQRQSTPFQEAVSPPKRANRIGSFPMPRPPLQDKRHRPPHRPRLSTRQADLVATCDEG